ncbi:arabinanase/levansucrase/invertase [Actinidia rufa]|uniref:Arabinanase/levansucrase/invertase n=1 Tax=Actinidia rufa TaxID=165716 RepID=A0A7J0HEJ8_9ERIC|nr:arabinanase/levansucrase/invertase [Actinidia rufa]
MLIVAWIYSFSNRMQNQALSSPLVYKGNDVADRFYKSFPNTSRLLPTDTNITVVATAAAEEGTEVTEKGTKEKEIGRSTRLRRKPARMEDYIITELLNSSLFFNIDTFNASAMAEGTRFAEIDDTIRSLNEFRKESETQIRDLNNSISRFIQAVDQRLEDRGESVRRSEESVVNTTHNSNHQYRSMKIELFLNPKNSPNPNPRNRASPLFLTRCSTKPNTDRSNATTDKNNSNSKPNSNFQGPTKPISSQPLSAPNSSFSRGLVFDLGSQNSWDSFEIGSPVVKRFLSDEEERWYMWYHGRSKENPGSDSVGVAVSSNGVHWERSGRPVQSGEDTGLVMNCSKDWWAFDTHSIRPCEVVIMSSAKVRANNAVYWLYYTGFSSEKVEFGDNSVEFIVHNPERAKILDDESVKMEDIGARIEGEHHTGALFDVGSDGEWDSMFIASPQVVFSWWAEKHRIGSVDGWVEELGTSFKVGRFLKPSEEDGWDNKEVGSPCLVQMDGNIDEWRLYYRGIGKRGEVGIGMAVSEGSEIRSLRRWTGFHL